MWEIRSYHKDGTRTYFIVELEGSREYCEKRLPDFPGAVIEWKCYEGGFCPLIFFGHFAQYTVGILCPSPMDVSHPWTSPIHGRPYSAHKCLSLAGGPRAGASRSARAEF